MMCSEVIREGKSCQQCGHAIEEGLFRNKPPTEAKYCLKCRAERRRRANFKYVWQPEYDEYLKAHYYVGDFLGAAAFRLEKESAVWSRKSL